MLPLSEVKFAKSMSNDSASMFMDWILFDVYKIAPDFPLEVSVYGYVFNKNTIDYENLAKPQDAIYERIKITDKFQSKSTRNDLMGLKLKCGLVVCIE